MQSLPMGTMKVHQFARGLITWDHHDPPSLSLACNKRLRPLAPKLPATPADSLAKDTSLHAKPQAIAEPDFTRRVETHPGGTRWNPTQEQIGILEMLYRGGVRTPNAQQIEQITVQLSKYGKIEGKNVFYWFQNHKARERQKQKRNSITHIISPRTSSSSSLTTITLGDGDHEKVEIKEEEHSPYKRKSRNWGFEWLEVEESRWSCKEEEDEGDRTLELFPLHPESR